MTEFEGSDYHDAITRAVGEELRRARNDRGWSRPGLVRRMRYPIPVNTYACYEQGIRPVSLPRLVELCETLGVAAPELFGLALQRAQVDPLNSGIWVDLRRVLADKREPLRPLRRWARYRLKHDVDDSGFALLDWSFINEVAVLMSLTGPELRGYLREFTPDAPPQRETRVRLDR